MTPKKSQVRKQLKAKALFDGMVSDIYAMREMIGLLLLSERGKRDTKRRKRKRRSP